MSVSKSCIRLGPLKDALPTELVSNFQFVREGVSCLTHRDEAKVRLDLQNFKQAATRQDDPRVVNFSRLAFLRLPEPALLTFCGSLGKFLQLWQHLVVR